MTCPYCKKEFVQKWANYKSKFCSRACANKSRANTKPKKEYFCKRCSVSLGFGWNVVGTTNFCNECNKNLVNWNTVLLTDFRNRFDNVNQYHSRLRSIARSVYEQSNKQKQCYVCGYVLHCQICHIKPVKDFIGTDSVGIVNHIDNLVALCPNHHWELDNGYLKLSTQDSNLEITDSESVALPLC